MEEREGKPNGDAIPKHTNHKSHNKDTKQPKEKTKKPHQKDSNKS